MPETVLSRANRRCFHLLLGPEELVWRWAKIVSVRDTKPAEAIGTTARPINTCLRLVRLGMPSLTFLKVRCECRLETESCGDPKIVSRGTVLRTLLTTL